VTDEAPEPIPIIPEVPRALSPLVRRICANNPGIMTGPGTNTYLVGVDEIAVIDPGPADDAHLDAVAGCGGDRIRWILLTHTHPDHGPGAAGLKERTGAEILAFDSRDGIEVDGTLGDGDKVEGTEWRLTAVHTPGHASNHLCFLLEEERCLFTGDHVMEGSTVVIKPPDGDMAAYLASLERVKAMRTAVLAPAHGHPIEQPQQVLAWYLEHRREREGAIAAALAEVGHATIDDLVAAVYTDVDPERHPIARHTVYAHLLKLAGEGKVSGDDLDGEWASN
jgi:glyoxylase-like metal-dependent hydrolase (beta-lactamase superfamily II)